MFFCILYRLNMAAFLSRYINDDAKCRRCPGQYACGGWERSNPIPDGKSSWSTFGKLWQDNQQVLRNILETPPSNQEVRISAAAINSTN
jgi:predicted metalloendopeptidase